jgi:hypothetical protein
MKQIKIIFTIIILTSSISAQHLGISFSKLWTDNYELENPNGFSINIAQPLFKYFEVQFEFSEFENRREYFGFLIGGFFATPPPKENIISISTLQVYEISAKYYFLNLELLRAAVGLGISLNKLDGSRLAEESGRRTSLFDESNFGIAGIFYMESRAIKILPVTLYTSIQKKQIAPGSQATDIETPFSETIDTYLLQIGAKFKF